jgi:hypothetical protein
MEQIAKIRLRLLLQREHRSGLKQKKKKQKVNKLFIVIGNANKTVCFWINILYLNA